MLGRVRSGIWTTGVSFAIELVLGWNVAYVATHKSQKLLILKRRQIASYYIRKGSFPFDFISTVIFVVEVRSAVLGAWLVALPSRPSAGAAGQHNIGACSPFNTA